jgi:hypothetical protein
MSNFADDDNESLRTQANRLLAPFGFAERNKREMWQACQTNIEGVERCALLAKAKAQREGLPSAGLLLTMIRASEHLHEADPDVRLPTGWRWVTGVGHAAGTYVRDLEGTDKLPPGYDLSTRSPIYEPAPTYEEAAPLTDDVKGELARLEGRE